MSWSSRVVECLLCAKAAGWDFEWAWAEALQMHPPGRREKRAMEKWSYGLRDETQVEFLRRACEDAWHGRRPLLRHLPGLLEAVGDERAVLAVDGYRRRSHVDMVA